MQESDEDNKIREDAFEIFKSTKTALKVIEDLAQSTLSTTDWSNIKGAYMSQMSFSKLKNLEDNKIGIVKI